MKKILIVTVITLLLTSCAVKHPVFIGVKETKLISVTDTLKLRTYAKFWNDNNNGKIITDNVEVFLSGVPVGRVEVKEMNVPMEQKFEIPLDAEIPYNKLKDGIMGGIVNSVLSKKVSLRIRGTITYRDKFKQKNYVIDKIEEVDIK